MIERVSDHAVSFVPFNEVERIRALTSTCLLDSACDPAFDAITHLAAKALGTPIAAVSLIDQHRQWFKSSVGLTCTETPREDSFCTHTILQRTPLIVLDAQQDRQFQNKATVNVANGVRFYMGVPIRAEGGMPLGALCVADSKPRTFVVPEAVALLQQLARNVEKLIRAHRAAGYIDAASGLPNQRRFRENMAAFGNRSDVAGERGLTWAVSVDVAAETQVRSWIAEGAEDLLDARLEDVSRWLAATTPVLDGIYRLSPRHVGCFIEAATESHVLSLTSVLQQRVSQLFPDASDGDAHAERQRIRAIPLCATSGQAAIDRLLCPAPLGAVFAKTMNASSPASVAPGDVSPHAFRLPDAVLSVPQATVAGMATGDLHDMAGVDARPRVSLSSRKCVGFDVDFGTNATVRDFPERFLSPFARWASRRLRSAGGDVGFAPINLHFAMRKAAFLTEDVAAWMRALTRLNVRPDQISWTISARDVRETLDPVRARCAHLRAHGIGVIVTGFGAGYDSLTWLPSLSISGVSLDPRVITAVRENKDHAATVRRIVSLVHALNGRVCAPLLDDAAQVAIAQSLNCDEGTGAALAPKMPNQVCVTTPDRSSKNKADPTPPTLKVI